MIMKLRLLALVLTLFHASSHRPPSVAASAWGLREAPLPTHGRLRPPARRIPAQPLPGLRLARYARRLIGIPYRWGGDSPATGFDCSGFVRFVYAHFGLRLPHSSYSDFALGVGVSRGGLRPGDLVFFDGLGHVGIYVGANRFIQAPHTGASVEITSLSAPWYSTAYDGARRLLGLHAPALRHA
jgi:cell wall-associated NlpC family hydrolase